MYYFKVIICFSIISILAQVECSAQHPIIIKPGETIEKKIDNLYFKESLSGFDSIRLIYKTNGTLNLGVTTKRYLDSTQKIDVNRYFEIAVDQDYLVFGTKTDKDYTMGVGFFWHTDSVTGKLAKHILRTLRLSFSNDGSFITKVLKLSDAESFYSHGLTFSGFTPDSLALYKVDSTDRPYSANVVYSSKRTFYKEKRKLNDLSKIGIEVSFQGSLGLIGYLPSKIGQFVQSGIHSGQAALKNDVNFDDTRPVPRGWPNAIENYSEMPFYNYSMDYNYVYTYTKQRFSLYSYLGGTADIGMLYNSLGVRSGFEIGFFNQKSFGSGLKYFKDLNSSKPNTKKVGWFGASLILNYVGSYILWNSNLQGIPFRSSVYTLEKEQVRNWNNFVEGGLRVKLGSMYISYLHAYRSQVAYLKQRSDLKFGRISLIFKY